MPQDYGPLRASFRILEIKSSKFAIVSALTVVESHNQGYYIISYDK